MPTTGISGRSSRGPALASLAHPWGGKGLTVPREEPREGT